MQKFHRSSCQAKCRPASEDKNDGPLKSPEKCPAKSKMESSFDLELGSNVACDCAAMRGMNAFCPSLLARVSVLLVVTGGARAVRVGHLRCGVSLSITMQTLGSSCGLHCRSSHTFGTSQNNVSLFCAQVILLMQKMSLQPTSTLATVTIIEKLCQ